MSRFLQTSPGCAQRPLFSCSAALLCAAFFLALGGCGDVTCPEPLSNVDGTCEKPKPATPRGPEPEAAPEPEPEPQVERCDGADNDGDTAVDESWPELGEVCGERAGVGECVEGVYACADDGLGVVCEGGVRPSDEVCDGKDNDCDGFVDEGVLSTKGEVFSDHATVTAVEGGFAVARIVGAQLRIETYDTSGNRTGHHDDIGISTSVDFIESDSAGKRVLVALGSHSFHVFEALVDSDLFPFVLDAQPLHAGWRQGEEWGLTSPPVHPRVVASPPRFLGYAALTFALSSFASDSLGGLAQAPIAVVEIPIEPFAVAGPFIAWEQDDNVRAAVLFNDGELALDIDLARGTAPAVAMTKDGPGMACLQNGELRLSELGGLALQCTEERFCNARIAGEELPGDLDGPTGLAFDEVTDTWFVMAGTQLAVVGRGEDGAVVKQANVLDALGAVPKRIDVAVSDSTAAVVQTAQNGESALTFVGCF